MDYISPTRASTTRVYHLFIGILGMPGTNYNTRLYM